MTNHATKFEQLDKDLQIEFCTIPQCVSVTVNPDDETEEDVFRRQEKFLKLPEEVKNKLVSYETSEIIQSIGKEYSLELLQMAAIARAIRSYYFNELKLEEFPQKLADEMKIDLEIAQKISQEVIKKVINSNFLLQTSNQNIVSLSLQQALNQYEKLGEQIITNQKIKVKPLNEEARPSIKNWIYDYHYHLGTGRHTVMERGNYLFHSENTKRLSDSERRKLALILKSLDEGESVKIDKEKEEIIFPLNDDNRALNDFQNEERKEKVEKKSREAGQSRKIIDFFSKKKTSNYSDKKINQDSKKKANNIIEKKEDGQQVTNKISSLSQKHPEHWLVGQNHKTMFRSFFEDNQKGMEETKRSSVKKIVKSKKSSQDSESLKTKMTMTRNVKDDKGLRNHNSQSQNKFIYFNGQNKNTKSENNKKYIRSHLFRIKPSGFTGDSESNEDILTAAKRVVDLRKEK